LDWQKAPYLAGEFNETKNGPPVGPHVAIVEGKFINWLATATSRTKIKIAHGALDCFASLAMTMLRHARRSFAFPRVRNVFYPQCDALCDCPTGKSLRFCKNLSSRLGENKSLREHPKSNLQFSLSRSHMRGASRSSRTLEAGCDGRGSVRRHHGATNDAVADGEIAWSWRPDAGAKLAEYEPQATVARKPGHRGDRV
jgi:hypothetical protein